MLNRTVSSVVFGSFFLFLLLTFGVSTLPAGEGESDRIDLTILYTGDEYGYLDPCG